MIFGAALVGRSVKGTANKKGSKHNAYSLSIIQNNIRISVLSPHSFTQSLKPTKRIG
ncbi:hypothetical protein KL86DPRO_11885 [uncultured delta proteobacterium]|uniref:Uncharacterized protein n=1 Tax=uncultured delta proteobacterium TaxID=34034 RepID=A0A212JNX9_9DELT|nr:hypothetical protein KL86DPRO_11885 [uncultured delta proteobacterium]